MRSRLDCMARRRVQSLEVREENKHQLNFLILTSTLYLLTTYLSISITPPPMRVPESPVGWLEKSSGLA